MRVRHWNDFDSTLTCLSSKPVKPGSYSCSGTQGSPMPSSPQPGAATAKSIPPSKNAEAIARVILAVDGTVLRLTASSMLILHCVVRRWPEPAAEGVLVHP